MPEITVMQYMYYTLGILALTFSVVGSLVLMFKKRKANKKFKYRSDKQKINYWTKVSKRKRTSPDKRNHALKRIKELK